MAFLIPNLAAAAHSDQAAPDSVDFSILTQGYGGSGVVSGCLVTPSAGLTVAIASGVIMVAGAVVSVTGTTKTSAPANATLPRFDLVVVDNAGTVTIQTGTAGTTPAFPVVPANNVALASLYIGAAQVTTSAAEIYDRRVILLNTMSGGVSTGGNTLGNTGQATNQLVLAGGNNITLSGSTQSGSMTVTIVGPSSGFSAGISALGNTLGTTGLIGSRIVYVGGSNITLSQSSNGQSATLTFIGAGGGVVSNGILDVSTATGSGTGTSQFAAHDHQHRGMRAWNVNGIASTFFGDIQYSAGANITLNTGGNSTAGSLQIVGPAAGGGTISMWMAGMREGISVGSQWDNKTLQIFPVFHQGYASASVADLYVSGNFSSSSNSSYAGVVSLSVAYFTLNASTLSSVSSGSAFYQWSNTSNNSQNSLVGIRRVTVPINLNITPGNYWIGVVSQTSTTNANWFTLSNMVWSVSTGGAALSGTFLGAINPGSIQILPGFGRMSFTSAGMASVALSDIVGKSGTDYFVPVMYLRNIISA